MPGGGGQGSWIMGRVREGEGWRRRRRHLSDGMILVGLAMIMREGWWTREKKKIGMFRKVMAKGRWIGCSDNPVVTYMATDLGIPEDVAVARREECRMPK